MELIFSQILKVELTLLLLTLSYPTVTLQQGNHDRREEGFVHVLNCQVLHYHWYTKLFGIYSRVGHSYFPVTFCVWKFLRKWCSVPLILPLLCEWRLLSRLHDRPEFYCRYCWQIDSVRMENPCWSNTDLVCFHHLVICLLPSAFCNVTFQKQCRRFSQQEDVISI